MSFVYEGCRWFSIRRPRRRAQDKVQCVREESRDKQACSIALGALGFGLCKTAISVAYITAMGSVSSTVGFVSELDFMFAMNAISFATALAIIALVRAGRLRPGALSQVPAVIALLVGFFLSATGVMAGLPFAATAVFYGVLCGFALTVLNAAWLEAFVAEPDAAYGVTKSWVG